MKKFYDKWNAKDITRYLSKKSPILVLFGIQRGSKEAEITIYGNGLNKKLKKMLMTFITKKFGGLVLTSKLCVEINEFAHKWYNSCIKKQKKIQILNFKKRKNK